MKNEIVRFAQRSSLKIQKKAPQILFVAGIAGSIGTVVLSSRATLKASVVLEEHRVARADLEEWKSANAIEDVDYKAVVIDQYRNTTKSMAKLYAPSIIVGVASIAALTRSHQILTSRNNALGVVVAGLHQMMADYRGRVVNELGEQKDLEFLHGTVTNEIDTGKKNKDGSPKMKEVTTLDPDGHSIYSYYFDAASPNWDRDHGYNHNYLQNQETWCNDRLKRKGFMTLNDVYDVLHIPRTRAGQVVGWVYDTTDGVDNFIDFGFRKDGDFVAGFVTDVWLDFNVDGEILDLIEKHGR